MSEEQNGAALAKLPKDTSDIWLTCIGMKQDIAVMKEQLKTLTMLMKIMLVATLGFAFTALYALIK